MNFTSEVIAPLSSLNWATAAEDYTPGKDVLHFVGVANNL
jgi:hypothetical protein